MSPLNKSIMKLIMRKLLLGLVFVLAVSSVSAQAFEGKEDMKFQIGTIFRKMVPELY